MGCRTRCPRPATPHGSRASDTHAGEGAPEASRGGRGRSGSWLFFEQGFRTPQTAPWLHCEAHPRKTMWTGAAGGHWDVLAFVLPLTWVDSAGGWCHCVCWVSAGLGARSPCQPTMCPRPSAVSFFLRTVGAHAGCTFARVLSVQVPPYEAYKQRRAEWPLTRGCRFMSTRPRCHYEGGTWSRSVVSRGHAMAMTDPIGVS